MADDLWYSQYKQIQHLKIGVRKIFHASLFSKKPILALILCILYLRARIKSTFKSQLNDSINVENGRYTSTAIYMFLTGIIVSPISFQIILRWDEFRE